MLVVAVVAVLWRLVALVQWSWFQDDWTYLERTADLDFWNYIGQNYNGHLMPLQFAVIWIITKLAPLQFTPAALISVAIFAAALAAWGRLLVELFGPRWRLLPLFGALALGPVWVPINLWWAASLQAYGLLMFTGLTLLFVQRHVARGDRRSFVLAIVSFTLCIAWWQKGLLTLIPAVFLAVAAPNVVGGSLRASIRSGRRLAGALAGVAVVGVTVFALATHTVVPGQPSFSLDRTLAAWLTYVQTAFFGVVAPALVGGPWADIANGQAIMPRVSATLMWTFAEVGVVFAVWLVFVRRRGAWVLLMLVCHGCVAYALIFLSTRYAVFGPDVARDARYSADVYPLTVLALAFAISSTTAERAARTRAWRARMPRVRFEAVLGTVAAVAVVNSALYTSNAMFGRALQLSPKPWVDNFVPAARTLDGVAIADSVAPLNVIQSAFFVSDGRISRMVLPLGVHPRWDAFSSDTRILDSAGHAVPMGVLKATGSQPAPIPGCGYLVTSGDWTFVPMETGVFAWNWALSIPYFSQRGGQMTIETKRGSREAALRPGVGTVTGIVIDEASYVRLRMTSGSGSVCVDNLVVGTPVPASQVPRASG